MSPRHGPQAPRVNDMTLQGRVRSLAAKLIVLISLWPVAIALAETRHDWLGVVTHVVDGDTIRVRPLHGGKPVSVRLEGLDAPEICQAGGAASREALRQRVQGHEVRVRGSRHDDYQRLLARVEREGEDVGAGMVRAGHAWSYHRRGDAGPYAAEQRQARAARAGLFASPTPPMYPGRFRREHGSCHAH